MAFVQDWHDQWSDLAGKFGAFDHDAALSVFTLWEQKVKELSERHFLKGQTDQESEGTFCFSSPDHDTGQEEVKRTQIDKDTATIETECHSGLSTFFEYALQRQDRDWRIVKIQRLFHDEDEEILSSEDRSRILAAVQDLTPHPPLPDSNEPNCDRLFEMGRQVRIFDEPARIEVTDLGRIQLASGVIGAYDLGWPPERFRPLRQRVPSGDFPVEIAKAGGFVIAARIRFDSTREAGQWIPAFPLEQDSHDVGVDYGNVSFFDAGNFMSLRQRELERIYHETVEASANNQGSGAHWVRLVSKPPACPDCVMVDSGMGDGSYPCYWGMAEDGEVVSLVADFLMVAEFLSETITVPWSSSDLGKKVVHPKLRKSQIQLSLKYDPDGESGFEVIGEHFERARLLNREGLVVCDSESGGQRCSTDGNFHYTTANLREIRDATLEIRIYLGYRN